PLDSSIMELLWNKSILELYFSGSWRDEEIAGKKGRRTNIRLDLHSVLRQYRCSIRADSDACTERHAVQARTIRNGIAAGPISEKCVINVRIGIKADAPH